MKKKSGNSLELPFKVVTNLNCLFEAIPLSNAELTFLDKNVEGGVELSRVGHKLWEIDKREKTIPCRESQGIWKIDENQGISDYLS